MKIGDVLYKYQGLGRLATYNCTAIITRAKLTLYEMECQSCTHEGDKCSILVGAKNKGSYQFIGAVNEDGEEWVAWHTTENKKELYYDSEYAALCSIYESLIKEQKTTIIKLEEAVRKEKKELELLEIHAHNITKKEKNE